MLRTGNLFCGAHRELLRIWLNLEGPRGSNRSLRRELGCRLLLAPTAVTLKAPSPKCCGSGASAGRPGAGFVAFPTHAPRQVATLRPHRRGEHCKPLHPVFLLFLS